jgi:hypothetical protein
MKAPPLTDRQRVELILPVLLLQDTVKGGHAGPRDAHREAYARLMATIVDLVADLEADHRSKIIRRATRAFREVSAPYRRDGACPTKFGMMAFYLLQRLVDDGMLVVGVASNLHAALDLILPNLEASADKARLAASAEKHADKLLRSLKALGYYRDAVPV